MVAKTIVAERTIPAPRAAVFDWFSDASNWTATPVVLSGKLARPGKDGAWGLGARRHVLLLGSWFDEEIVAFDPPTVFEYRICRSFPPLRKELGRMEFREQAGGTHVVWTRWITAPWFLAPMLTLGTVIARWTFGRVLAAGDRSLRGAP